jgi:hypothetical protein
LVELLLTLLLGMLLSGLILQCVLSESRSGQKLARLLRERQATNRALGLIRSELEQASRVSVVAENSDGLEPSCNLGGRELVLQLQTKQGVIIYTQGTAPDAIWRGAVLMRCGPAYGADGQLGSSTPQNRVLLDQLAVPQPLLTPSAAEGVLMLRLRRELSDLQVISEMLVALP